MPRKFIIVGCVNDVYIRPSSTSNPPPSPVKGQVVHCLRVEDTFFNNPSFMAWMKMDTLTNLSSQYKGVTAYQHRVTSDACALGVFNRFSFTVRAKDPTKVTPRFGEASKIIQPGCGTLSAADLKRTVASVTLLLDGAEYFVDPARITTVSGRKYKPQ